MDDPIRKFMSMHGFFEMLDDTAFELRTKYEDLESFIQLQWLDLQRNSHLYTPQQQEQLASDIEDATVKAVHIRQVFQTIVITMVEMEESSHPDYEMYMLQIDIANESDDYDDC